jgi:hypothetical protein
VVLKPFDANLLHFPNGPGLKFFVDNCGLRRVATEHAISLVSRRACRGWALFFFPVHEYAAEYDEERC